MTVNRAAARARWIMRRRAFFARDEEAGQATAMPASTSSPEQHLRWVRPQTTGAAGRASALPLYLLRTGWCITVSQQRGYSRELLWRVTTVGDVRREFLTQKSCAPPTAPSPVVHQTSLG